LTCISKSANKHNRLYCNAQPLTEELCVAIEKDMIALETKDIKSRAQILVDEHGWDKNDALRLWSFGCPPDGT
jgi:elongation factor 2